MADRYDVIDKQTKQVVGSYKSRHSARRSADRRDTAYGACRYIVKPIWAEQVAA